MDDPLIKKFFERIEEEVVKPHVIQGEKWLRAHRTPTSQNYRTGPVLKIAEELGLFEHVERKDIHGWGGSAEEGKL
jgi:hypothetical protein